MAAADDSPFNVLAELERNPNITIAGDLVRKWMESSDVEILGALDALLDGPRTSKAIRPPLSIREIDDFRAMYYRLCLRTNPRSDWAMSRYETGWTLVNWIQYLAHQPELSVESIERWKRWLADEYKRGDEEIRVCLINATLEHLFERPEIKQRFEDWREDTELREAFNRASEWAHPKKRQ